MSDASSENETQNSEQPTERIKRYRKRYKRGLYKDYDEKYKYDQDLRTQRLWELQRDHNAQQLEVAYSTGNISTDIISNNNLNLLTVENTINDNNENISDVENNTNGKNYTNVFYKD